VDWTLAGRIGYGYYWSLRGFAAIVVPVSLQWLRWELLLIGDEEIQYDSKLATGCIAAVEELVY